MRVALGTVTVDEGDRAAIAWFQGKVGLASHQEVREHVLRWGTDLYMIRSELAHAIRHNLYAEDRRGEWLDLWRRG